MRHFSPAAALALVLAFAAGFCSHLLYRRWTASLSPTRAASFSIDDSQPQAHPVSYAPLPAAVEPEPPLIEAREVNQIRALAGRQARIRGAVYRVGHSAKSNTYFVSFGPSREALTGIIFGSAAELFEKNKLPPKALEAKEIEVKGEIKDHPQYGLEIIIENPAQVKVIK